MTNTNNSKRAPIPQAVRRLWWWFAGPAVATVFGVIAYQIPTVRNATATPDPWITLGIPAVILAPNFLVILPVWWGMRRIKRAVAGTSGRACTNCVHDLSGLGDTGMCPECGRAFDIAADQRSWVRVKVLK